MGNPLQLRPIDIGFDPRVHGMEIAVNLDQRYDGCTYERARKDEDEIPGSAEIRCWDASLIGAVAKREGYRLRWQWPSQEQRLEAWSARIVNLRTGEPVLEMTNPSEGQDPSAPKSRYQYLVQSNVLATRRLPPRGSKWRGEPEPPWWEPVRVEALHSPHLLLDWMQVCGSTLEPWQSHSLTHHIVAWTPNGRELRFDPDGGVALQPPLDNWWHRCADLAAAREWWYQQDGSRS